MRIPAILGFQWLPRRSLRAYWRTYWGTDVFVIPQRCWRPHSGMTVESDWLGNNAHRVEKASSIRRFPSRARKRDYKPSGLGTHGGWSLLTLWHQDDLASGSRRFRTFARIIEPPHNARRLQPSAFCLPFPTHHFVNKTCNGRLTTASRPPRVSCCLVLSAYFVLQSLAGDERDQVTHTAGVTPLVVVPGDDLDQRAVDYLGEAGVDHG